ncbi:MAG TPA: hypothetical protein VLZ12_01925 [Verrucomicrobiae bacterium]|nr:hypothetical protein [Verrucomicrobiae bacterium]
MTAPSKLCLCVALTFGAWRGLLVADTIQLNDGTALDGTIVSETPTDVTIEVEFAAGTITKTQTVSSNEIAQIIRSTPEQRAVRAMEFAYQRTLRYNLDPNRSYSPRYYDDVINSVFQRYLADYPGSPHTLQISARIQEWEAARDHALAAQGQLEAQRAAPIGPTGVRVDSPDVLSRMASWFQEYWAAFAAAAVVGLWILSRVLSR